MKNFDQTTDQNLQEILHAAPFGFFKLDLDGNALFVSKSWEDITGLEVGVSLGKGWHSVLVPEDIPVIATAIRAATTGQKQTVAFGFRIHHPQSGIRFCRMDVRLIQNEQDRSQCLIGYVQDVTDDHLTHIKLKEAESRQREMNTYLTSLIASLEDIVLEIDTERRFINVWAKDETLFFLPKEKFIGKTIAEVFPHMESLFSAPITAAIRTGEPQEFEYKHIDPTIDKWFKAKVTMVSKTNQPTEQQRLALTIQDITSRIKQEQALKQTKALLERTNQILESSQKLSNTGGWEFDVLTGEMFWTNQTKLIFEIGENDTINYQDILTLCDPGYDYIFDQHIRRSLEKKEPHDFIFRIRDKKWLRSIGFPVVENNCVVKLRGATMDITEQMKTTQALLEAKNKAEEAAQAKTDFLSVMSHEIRTPLNGIIGISNLLKMNRFQDHQAYVDNLIFSADHLLQLINDILDLTKIDSDHVELVQNEVNLFELLQRITNQFNSLAESKNIDLITFVDPGIPEKIIADAVRINQILNNLISNALKYTDAGKVTVALQALSCDAHKVTIRFTIKDTGIGIPEEYHEVIFDSFKQVQQPASRKHTGTGLGLAITKKLIELHNSHISMESTMGKGTTFRFDIAFDLPQSNMAIDQPSISYSVDTYANKLGDLRVLLVEDNPINAMVAQKQLAYFGIVPDCAYDGLEALSLLKNNAYHIAFIDLHMPGMDGQALSEFVHKHYPDTHIVISTADIMGDVRVRLSEIHAYDILNKPVVLEKLLVFLLKVAEQRSIISMESALDEQP
ncbi:PAS domain S-box protein [Parapedobacter sp. ISTM3]|uniref:ATP-binding protein n=1 Tax=Parapedobacter sp. ISTM3 TaxID=2800130 RepID=UPI001908387A|nr:ATP-binding protein [Parapedobacter sp. ISTM3]MBK1441765.1 PAS domain S-box protein [Parapedobacter sp. ISTM3]